MIDLDDLTQIIEAGLAGLPSNLKQRHRAQLLDAFQVSLSRRAKAIGERSLAPELALLSIRELKQRAAEANITRYGSLDKAALVAELVKRSR